MISCTLGSTYKYRPDVFQLISVSPKLSDIFHGYPCVSVGNFSNLGDFSAREVTNSLKVQSRFRKSKNPENKVAACKLREFSEESTLEFFLQASQNVALLVTLLTQWNL